SPVTLELVLVSGWIERNSGQQSGPHQIRKTLWPMPVTLSVGFYQLIQLANRFIHLQRPQVPGRRAADILVGRGFINGAPQQLCSLSFAAMFGRLRGQHSQERMSVGTLRAAQKYLGGFLVVL